MSSDSVMVIDSSVELFDQPINLYPSSGVAVIVTSLPSSYSPPSVDTLPPSVDVTVTVYTGISSKRASSVVSSDSVMVIDSSVELFDQPINLYPSSGVAVIVTSVPSSYSPPSVDTLPPSVDVTVTVYTGISSKTASIEVSSDNVMVIDSSVLPSDQPINLYPSSGVAVIVTSVPSLYSPPSLDIDPPSVDVTVN